MAHSSSPYITVYKRWRLIYQARHRACLALATVVRSPEGTYLAVAHRDPPYITVYKRDGDYSPSSVLRLCPTLATPGVPPDGTSWPCHPQLAYIRHTRDGDHSPSPVLRLCPAWQWVAFSLDGPLVRGAYSRPTLQYTREMATIYQAPALRLCPIIAIVVRSPEGLTWPWRLPACPTLQHKERATIYQLRVLRPAQHSNSCAFRRKGLTWP